MQLYCRIQAHSVTFDLGLMKPAFSPDGLKSAGHTERSRWYRRSRSTGRSSVSSPPTCAISQIYPTQSSASFHSRARNYRANRSRWRHQIRCRTGDAPRGCGRWTHTVRCRLGRRSCNRCRRCRRGADSYTAISRCLSCASHDSQEPVRYTTTVCEFRTFDAEFE